MIFISSLLGWICVLDTLNIPSSSSLVFGPSPNPSLYRNPSDGLYYRLNVEALGTGLSRRTRLSKKLFSSKTPPGGIDFEVQEQQTESTKSTTIKTPPATISPSESETSSSNKTRPTSIITDNSNKNISSSSTSMIPFQNRGKVNEIDFCMSPSDVSLSRSYQQTTSSSLFNQLSSSQNNGTNDNSNNIKEQQPRILSLTRALNNASNRAVRRILLSRSWPSAEALNLSLKQYLASSSRTTSVGDDERDADTTTTTSTNSDNNAKSSSKSNTNNDSTKCPVPRPILNIIVGKNNNNNSNINNTNTTIPITQGQMSSSSTTAPNPLSKIKLTDEQWVDEQMKAFRETYGLLPGYEYADAYMQCILSLATSGIESDRVSDVIAGGVYDDSYRRLIAVLKTAGAVFEGEVDELTNNPRMKIARKLKDQDICLSMIDKIAIRNEKILEQQEIVDGNNNFMDDNDDAADIDIGMKKREQIILDEGVAAIDKDKEEEEEKVKSVSDEKLKDTEEVNQKDRKLTREKKKDSVGLRDRLLFFMKKNDKAGDEEGKEDDEEKQENSISSENYEEEIKDEMKKLKREDLGAVLLSAEEPSVTRQLNVLSNIVQRALLFGGDQELLVLSETLEADKPAFIQRWYPDSDVNDVNDLKNESRPGVQFFNCLVQLLKDSYTFGVVTDLDPPYPLSFGFANSYERLTALLVELGSGYIKPVNNKKMQKIIPKTPKEELVRFSQWEVSLRQIKPDVLNYPPDLVGSWQVKDEIGGKIIGTSTVVFKSEGEVYVDPPLRGLRWRLDPGPTHLDTCTFQVLNEDGAIIQYRGFLDRGARLEARFSKRAIKIRGAVTFQMRDGETALLGEDYKRDMLPIDTTTGTTRFLMTKVFDLNDD